MCPPTHTENESVFRRRKIRCVLVHDHMLLREGLRRLLEDEPDLEVAGAAGNAAEALRLVFEQRPEVVLVDLATLGLAAGDAERLIRRESPHSKILFLTMREAGDAELAAITADRAALVVRHTTAEELVKMVRNADGERHSEVREMPRKDGDWEDGEALSPRRRVLTAREREVLKLLAEGRTVRSAAEVLGLSVKTVDAHKFNLMRKLGIHNKAELVMWAIQKRVVKIPVNL